MRTLGLLPGSARAFGGFGRSGGGLFAKKVGNSGSSGPGYDPNAQAYFTAAGITDPTQQSAWNTFVVTGKSDGWYSKLQAAYPIMGGTAAKHKWNAIDPRDLDAAFRGTFVGTVTHSANGMVSDGSTGYMDTHYVPSVNGTNNNTSLGFYSRTDTTTGAVVIGGGGAAGSATAVLISPSALAGPANTLAQIYSSDFANTAYIGGTLGLFAISRTSSTVQHYFQNAFALPGPNPSTSAGIAGATSSIFVLANNNGGVAGNFSPCQGAFAYIGLGLSDADHLNLSAAVQAFQTALGRQV